MDNSDRWAYFGTILFYALMLVGLVSLSMSSPVKGHDSWISRERIVDPVTNEWCCNHIDCAEEVSGVEAVDGGYLIKSTGEVIPRERVVWRSPGGWWRCRYLGGEKFGKTRCLIGPPQGS